MIVLRYILGFLFLGGCWHAGALALGPDLLPDPVAHDQALRRVSEHA